MTDTARHCGVWRFWADGRQQWVTDHRAFDALAPGSGGSPLAALCQACTLLAAQYTPGRPGVRARWDGGREGGHDRP